MFLFQEVCGGKGLVDKYLSSSLCLAFLVQTQEALGLPQGHLQGSGSVRGGGFLVETRWMPLIEWEMWGENWWTWSGHGVHRTQGGQGS
jgi:hypothetical protein